ncbi:PAS domain S-box protein [Deinococcus deserti]|uniref:histidine kinase n=2 Tax=Deinococcus TaxID=1298 RepID=C1D0Y9_DEIDV|nr:putative histidine kinase, classic [Deinococcus deserti VCD115]
MQKPPLQPYILTYQLGSWLFLLAVAIAVALGMHRLEQNTRANMQAQSELVALQSVSAALVDQQAGVRGYVLTGEDRYLEVYQRGLAALPQHFGTLRTLAGSEAPAVRQARLDVLRDLERLHKQWLDTAATPGVAETRLGNSSPAVQIVRAGEGTGLMDEMRALLDEQRNTVGARQATLNQTTLATLQQVRWLTLGGLMLALLVSILVTTRATRTVAKGLRSVSDAARRITDGQLDERVPLGPVQEGALLGVAFNELTDQLRRQESQQERSSTRNRLILEAVGDGVISTDMHGRGTFANPAALSMTGYALPDIIGQDIHERLHHAREDGKAYPALECPACRAVEDGKAPALAAATFWRQDGSSFPVEYVVIPIRGEDGVVEGSIISFRDVTERRAAHRTLLLREALLQAVTANLPVVLFALDRSGEFTLVEGQQLTDLGFGSEKLVGQNLHARPNNLEMTDHFEAALRGEEPQFTVDVDGKTLDVWLTPLANKDNGVSYVIGAAVDVTERLRTELELREANRNLLESNTEFEQIAHVISHDLQAPLQAVISSTEQLKGQLDGQLDAQSKTYVGHIADGAHRMKRMIDDLLMYARVDRGERELQDVPLENVLQGVQHTLVDTLTASEAVLTHDPLPAVRGDLTELTALLQHLIENAVKYRAPDRTPTIHVGATLEGTGWHFTVSDNGLGIDTQDFARIFKVFQRLHHQDTVEGTGVGLAMCRKIVERAGGRMWVESVRGSGSSFHFTLPKGSTDLGPEDKVRALIEQAVKGLYKDK